jgi:hypothetical protein
MRKVSITQLQAANPGWFSPENRRFFGDIAYRTVEGGDNRTYLLRSTHAWSDMFGQPKRTIWRVNPINPDSLKIEPLLPQEFNSLLDVLDYLKVL